MGRPGRHHPGAVRLRHLRHRVRAGVLPQHLPGGRHPGQLLRLRRRVPRPATGRAVLLPLRRPARPQADPRRHPDADGRLDVADRVAPDLRDDRGARPGAAGALPVPAGVRGRRRAGRRRDPAHRDGRSWPPGPLRLAGHGGCGAGYRAGRGGLGRGPAARPGGAARVGLAAGVRVQPGRHRRRHDHPAQARREPGLHRAEGDPRRAAPTGGRGVPARAAADAAGSVHERRRQRAVLHLPGVRRVLPGVLDRCGRVVRAAGAPGRGDLRGHRGLRVRGAVGPVRAPSGLLDDPRRHGPPAGTRVHRVRHREPGRDRRDHDRELRPGGERRRRGPDELVPRAVRQPLPLRRCHPGPGVLLRARGWGWRR